MILVAAGAVVILGGATAIAWDVAQPPPPPPPELEAVETFPGLQPVHVPDGTPAEYNSDPPTSGPHSGTPAPCGIYRQPVPDVNQLHSMEHGAVVVQYDPALSEAEIALIEDIDWGPADEVIVAPRPGNPAPVALTSWTKRLLLDQVDVEVITAFDREFGNITSPEGAAVCSMQIDDRP